MGAEALKLEQKGALYRLGQRLFPKTPPMSYEENEAFLAKMRRLAIPPGLEGGLNPLWIIILIVDGGMGILGFNKPEYMPKYEKPSAPPPKLSGDSNPLGEFMTAFNEVMENLHHWET